MPTLLNGRCIYCHARVRVQSGRDNLLVTCRACGREMLASETTRSRSGSLSRLIWMAVAVLAIIGLVELGYQYRTPLLIGYDFLVDETGSNIAAIGAIVLGLFVLLCFVSWMVFPMLVALSMRKLRRRTLELEETTRFCARQLARIATSQNGATNPANSDGAATPVPTEPQLASEDGSQPERAGAE